LIGLGVTNTLGSERRRTSAQRQQRKVQNREASTWGELDKSASGVNSELTEAVYKKKKGHPCAGGKENKSRAGSQRMKAGSLMQRVGRKGRGKDGVRIVIRRGKKRRKGAAGILKSGHMHGTPQKLLSGQKSPLF